MLKPAIQEIFLSRVVSRLLKNRSSGWPDFEVERREVDPHGAVTNCRAFEHVGVAVLYKEEEKYRLLEPFDPCGDISENPLGSRKFWSRSIYF